MNAKQIATLFKDDLWKDQRTLETYSTTNGKTLVKHYPSSLEKETELSVTKFLRQCGIAGIPPISSSGTNNLVAEMPYFEGIRLFNLFVALDAVRFQTNGRAASVKKQLIVKCESRQREIQNALLLWRETQKCRSAYPQSKLLTIVDVLSYGLKLNIYRAEIEEEINRINDYYRRIAIVPFRDATPKNMILCCADLYTEKFQSDDERNQYIIECLQDNTYQKWMGAPIVDIDFCSCVHDTTFEDDVISLKYHERTWNGLMPSSQELLWNGTPDNKRAAISFLVRYFRFGGRKAAYRLLHPVGHRVRFKYDNDCFYFSQLPKFIDSLWPEFRTEYPNLAVFINSVARNLPYQDEVTDLFLEYFPEISMNSNYYTDVFPY